MSQYYLMAQLPSLDGLDNGDVLPITEERFMELCDRFLGKKTKGILSALTLVPARDVENDDGGFAKNWYQGERQLRLALGICRAEKQGKDFETALAPIPQPIFQAARTAVAMEDPMEAERYLLKYRLAFLETLRPADAFAEEAVVYYGLKLKLLTRMHRFDEDTGRKAYHSIYNAIMHREEREAEA